MNTTNFDLDTPILNFSDEPLSSAFTLRDACQAIQIFGGVGSGKTSGSGATIAQKFLAIGMGGLVLTCKPDEKDQWLRYARETGREKDLIIVEPGGKHFFNFLEYLSTSYRPAGTTIVGNIVGVLKTVIEASKEKTGGSSDDQFWLQALDSLIYNAVSLCLLASDQITIRQLHGIVTTAPIKGEIKEENKRVDSFDYIFSLVQKKIDEKINDFKKNVPLYKAKLFKENEVEFEKAIFEAIPEAETVQLIADFFFETYKNLSEKTRSIINFSFSNFLSDLLKEPFHQLFCKYPSTFKPESCFDGKIIILNLPTKLFHKVGRDCQVMFKLIWQKAMEQRVINESTRPCFLFADEAQNFLHEHDTDFQATARSSRIAIIYLTQNLPNYYSVMGGKTAEYRVKSLLGTAGTKIFHANSDIETNRYASDLIGQAYQQDFSKSKTMAGSFSFTQGESWRLESMVRPEEFISLKSGGPQNNYLVEGYMVRQGKPFANKMHFKKITFSQKLF